MGEVGSGDGVDLGVWVDLGVSRDVVVLGCLEIRYYYLYIYARA